MVHDRAMIIKTEGRWSELFGLKSLLIGNLHRILKIIRPLPFQKSRGFIFNRKMFLALPDFFHPFRIPFPGDFKRDCAANHDSEQTGIGKCPKIYMGRNRHYEEHESTIVHEMGSER